MDREQQIRTSESFLARHHGRPILFLPNVWDCLSARLFVVAGFDAIATTSGGVAWALGYPDGERAPWPEVVAATARIVRSAQVPVTADIEAGYGTTPSEVAMHVIEIIRTGVVGINLEDGLDGSIRSIDDAAARLQAAREAAKKEGVPIVINARCDIFHLKNHEEKLRLPATLERCKAYLAAGADCVYPFGLRDPAIIAALTKSLDAPVNITGRPGLPSLSELERMGVARVTIASAPTLVTMSAIQKLAAELHATGGFAALAASFYRPEAQSLFQ